MDESDGSTVGGDLWEQCKELDKTHQLHICPTSFFSLSLSLVQPVCLLWDWVRSTVPGCHVKPPSLSCLLTCLRVTCYTQCLDLLDRDEKIHSSHIKHIQSSDTCLFLHVRKRRDLKTCIWTEGCERASKSDLTEMKCGISNPQVPTECDYSWDNWALWLFSFLWSDRQKIWVLYSSLLVAETETSWSWRLLGTETESSTTQCSLSVRVCLYSTCFSISSISAPSVGPHLSLPQSFSTCSPSVMELAALISSCCILLEADVFTVVWGPDQSLCLSLSLSTVTCVSVRAAEDFSLVSVLLLVALGDFRKSQMEEFYFHDWILCFTAWTEQQCCAAPVLRHYCENTAGLHCFYSLGYCVQNKRL